MTRTAKKQPPRNRELGRIHILKSQLKLDDESYRNVLWTVARVESSKDLDEHGRRQVIEHLESHLARRDPKAAGRKFPRRPHNADAKNRQTLRKIEAYLTDAGREWPYVEAMALHMYGKQRLAFCDDVELAGLIAALDGEAKKRLQPALDAELKALGLDWRYAKIAAVELFDFGPRRNVDTSAQAMSQLLRWLQGRLMPLPKCAWPPAR